MTLLDARFPLSVRAPFTRRTALAAGLSDKALARLTRVGLLRHPIRDVYVAAQAPDDIATRIAILRLVVPDDCFVVDRIAAWLHGAPMALAPNDHLAAPRVAMFRPADRGRLRNGLARSGERTLLPRDLTVVGGLAVTTPLRTALDLGRLLHRDQALGGMDALLGLRAFSREELLLEIPRLAGERGVRQLRLLAPLADGRAQSPGESALRLRWLDSGAPRPELQIPVVDRGREVFYLDMGLEELLFGAEYDGDEFHTSDEDMRHDASRRDWLDRQRGWSIEVFRKGDVYGTSNPEAVIWSAYVKARATLGARTYFP